MLQKKMKMTNGLLNGLLIVGALVLGFGASSWWSARAAHKAAAVSPAPTTEAVLAAASQPGAAPLDLGALRAMIREEVQQARPAGAENAAPKDPSGDPSPDSPATPKASDRPRTPEQVTAQLEANTLVEDGLASGHWRDEDERRWLELRENMATPDAAVLRLKLFAALNEGKVAGDFDIRRGARPPEAHQATP